MSKNNKGPVVVAVINMKGGVGKSTISVLLARYGAFNKGLKVLAIDLDPQANLSNGLMNWGYRDFLNSDKPSIADVFAGYNPPSDSKPAPHTISGKDAIINLRPDEQLQLIPSRFDFSDNLVDFLRPDPRVLARHLSKFHSDRDIVLIDCAPTESVLTYAAYYASRYVLVPVRPEYFATIGFPLLRESMDNFRSRNKRHKIEVCGIVVNNAFYDGGNDGGPERRDSMQEIRREAKKNGWRLFKNEIPHSKGFPKMMRGRFSHLGNAFMFNHFAKEFFSRLELQR